MHKELIGVLRGCNKNTRDFVFSILEDSVYRIGKDESSDICINIEDLICDNHCVVASSAPDLPNNNAPNVYLTDTSTTGTFLNGCRIGLNKTVLLYSGCIITFATKHLSLQYIQYIPEDDRFPVFSMTIQPGSFSSPIQEVNTSREITIQSTHTEIGFGNQSYILLAYDTRNANRQLACKYTNLKKSHLQRWLMRAWETELNVLKSNKHPNVLSLVAHHENEQQRFVFLPMYYGGSLQERLNEMDPSLNRMGERNATFLMKQLCKGLDYLHDKGIIHCDIKPANILLADRYTDGPRLVIADFGHSMYKLQKPERWPDDWGTPAYRSPEQVKLQEFSEKVDCWAAGIIFYQLLVGEHPFHWLEEQELGEAIVVQEIDLEPIALLNISPKCRNTIAQLTNKDQYQRATIKQVMGGFLCDWFNGDNQAASNHYMKEREWWFDEEVPAIKQSTGIDFDRLPEAVETIKTFRDPSNPNTFISAAQTDFSLYPSLAKRIDSFKPSQFF